MINAADTEATLKEEFYVDGYEGKRIGFGENLLYHLKAHHGEKDRISRLERLLYALETVREPDRVEKGAKGDQRRTKYLKVFKDFGIFAISAPDDQTNVEYVFCISGP